MITVRYNNLSMEDCILLQCCTPLLHDVRHQQQEAGGRLASQVYLFMTQITRSNLAVLCRYRGRGAACVQNNQHVAVLQITEPVLGKHIFTTVCLSCFDNS